MGSTDLNLLVDVGFNQEVAKDTALYWNRSQGSLAQLINKVDNIENDKIIELGKKAKERVSKEYTWKKICDKYEKTFVK
mgnify:FL=1